jgi:O-antigen ligase
MRKWLFATMLFSTIPAGFDVAMAGRTPHVSLFDFALTLTIIALVGGTILGISVLDWGDSTLGWLAAVEILLMTMSLLVNLSDVLRGVVALKIFIFGFLAYVVCLSLVRTNRDLAYALTALIVWGGFIGLLLAFHFVKDWSSELGAVASYDAKNEIGLSMGRSNYVAAMLVMILPIGIARAVELKKFQRLLSIVPVGFIVLGLLITASKGAFSACFVGLCLSYPLLRQVGLRMKYVLIVSAIGLLVLALLPGQLLAFNFQMILFRVDNPDLTRADLWNTAWHQFLHNPVLGVGPNAIYLFNYRSQQQDLYSHNFVLNTLADLGLIGALPFFAMLAFLVKRVYRLCISLIAEQRRSYVPFGLFVGLVSTLMHGLVEPTFPGQEYAVLFWILAGLITIYSRNVASPRRLVTRLAPGSL